MEPNPATGTDWVAIISAVGAAVAAVISAWMSALGNQKNKVIVASLKAQEEEHKHIDAPAPTKKEGE